MTCLVPRGIVFSTTEAAESTAHWGAVGRCKQRASWSRVADHARTARSSGGHTPHNGASPLVPPFGAALRRGVRPPPSPWRGGTSLPARQTDSTAPLCRALEEDDGEGCRARV